MTDPPTKTELLDRIQSAYADLEQVLAQIPATRLTEADVTELWSVHDLLAHMLYWQSFLHTQIQAVAKHDEPPHLRSESQADTDQINEQAVLTRRFDPWDVLHAEFQRSVQNMLQTVESLSEDDLFTIGRFRAIDDGPLWRCIAGETYEHYETHVKHIQTWLHTFNR